KQEINDAENAVLLSKESSAESHENWPSGICRQNVVAEFRIFTPFRSLSDSYISIWAQMNRSSQSAGVRSMRRSTSFELPLLVRVGWEGSQRYMTIRRMPPP